MISSVGLSRKYKKKIKSIATTVSEENCPEFVQNPLQLRGFTFYLQYPVTRYKSRAAEAVDCQGMPHLTLRRDQDTDAGCLSSEPVRHTKC